MTMFKCWEGIRQHTGRRDWEEVELAEPRAGTFPHQGSNQLTAFTKEGQRGAGWLALLSLSLSHSFSLSASLARATSG